MAATMAFADPNLQLAVLHSLWREHLLPALDLEALRREIAPVLDDPDEDDPEYVFNSELATHLLAQPLPASQLARLATVEPANAIETALYPQWDGEDELFDVRSLAGIEACTELTALELDACDVDDLAPVGKLRGLRRLVLRGEVRVTSLRGLRGLPALEELALGYTHLTDLSALAELPRLRKVRIRWSGDAKRTAGLAAKHAELLARLRARKVKVSLDWPDDALPPKPVKPPRPAKPPRVSAEVARLGPFATPPFKGVAKLTWTAGKLRAATLPCMSTGADNGDVLAALLALPAARSLEALEVKTHAFRRGEAAKVLAAAKPPPPLRVLRLVTGYTDPAPGELGDVGALSRRYPQLREVELEGEPKLAGLALPSCTAFTLVSWSLPKAAGAAVLGASWPKLERLRIDFGMAYDGPGKTALQALLDGKRFPRLRHLRLRDLPDGDDFAAALAGSALIRRLATLDLRGCDVEPDDARALRKLTKLTL